MEEDEDRQEKMFCIFNQPEIIQKENEMKSLLDEKNPFQCFSFVGFSQAERKKNFSFHYFCCLIIFYINFGYLNVLFFLLFGFSSFFGKKVFVCDYCKLFREGLSRKHKGDVYCTIRRNMLLLFMNEIIR